MPCESGFSLAEMDIFTLLVVFGKAREAQKNLLVPSLGKRLATNETPLFQSSKMKLSELAEPASPRMSSD